MIIAGLDSALRRSGAGVLDGQRFVHAEAFTARGETHAEIFHNFRAWWRAFLVAHGVEAAAIEEPLRSDIFKTEFDTEQSDAFKQRKVRKPILTMKTLLGLYGARAHAIEICHTLNVDWIEVNNQDWRQVIHGRRSAPKGTTDASAWWKSQALQRCELLGWSVPSKDAAEGALIAEWRRISLSPMGALAGGLFAQQEQERVPA